MSRCGSRLLGAGVVVLASTLLAAPAASAIIARMGNGRLYSYQPTRVRAEARALAIPFDSHFTNVEYGGGPVMPQTITYTFYWDPAGAPEYPSGYVAGVNEYLENLQHDSGLTSNSNSVAAQYGDAEGSFANYITSFAGEIKDTQAYPTNGCSEGTTCLSSEQVEKAVSEYVTQHPGIEGLEHELFVLLPPGVVECAGATECSVNATKGASQKFCAYHTNLTLANGKTVIYSVDPYVSGNPGCVPGEEIHPPYEGAISGGLSHELMESISDPLPDTGWFDSTHTTEDEPEGSEIADQCASEYDPPLGEVGGKPYNEVVNGVDYYYQEVWSDFQHSCMQRVGVVRHEVNANFKVKAGSTEGELVFEAEPSAFASYYDWRIMQPNGQFLHAEEVTTPKLAYKFPSTHGLYVVALTVFEGDGSAIGSARSIYVPAPHEEGPEPAITKPARVVVGSPATFSAKGSTVSSGLIGSYQWVLQSAFSIGELPQRNSGETFTTTINNPGEYRLTLTTEDELGQRASRSEVIEAKREQTVSFETTPPTNATVGSKYQPKASASSGLPVKISLAAASAGVCKLEGEAVVATAAGTCTIEANQEGNGEYFAASATPQSYKVVEESSTTTSSTTTSSTTTSSSSSSSTTSSTTTSSSSSSSTTSSTTTSSSSTTATMVTSATSTSVNSSTTSSAYTTSTTTAGEEHGSGQGKAVAQLKRILRHGRQLVLAVRSAHPGRALLRVIVRRIGRTCSKVHGRRRCLSLRPLVYKTHLRLRRGIQRLRLRFGKPILRLLRSGPVVVQAVVVLDGRESRLQARIGGKGHGRRR